MYTIQEIEKKLFSRSLADLVAKLEQAQRLKRAWKLIERDYADPDLHLKRAAREIGASKNHLNLLLKRTTSFTFYQLLRRCRLIRALDTMRNKNRNLLDVALDSGFGSLSAFERNCRTILGGPPRALRENDDDR